MFSNLNKPSFGTTAANTSFGFGSAPVNPFGQSQLFGKTTTTGFGSTTTPAFGQTSTSSVFPSTQQQPQSSTLFQNRNAPAFGTTATNQFGSNIFGSTNQQTAGSSLFGGTSFGSQSALGSQSTQIKPTFGFGSTSAQPILFSSSQPTQSAGNVFASTATSNLFGQGDPNSSFNEAPAGTVIKFTPLTGTDTMQKAGLTTTISTKHHCITCMKEYEGKSLEELRWEDYQANRKGPQQQTGFGAAPFGSAGTTPSMSIFGQTQNKTAFGQPTAFGTNPSGFGLTSQPSASTSYFGKPSTGFGTTTTAGNTFGFSSTVGSSPFGTSSPAKPFAPQTTQPLFGTGTMQPTPSFGTGNVFGMQNNQSSTGLFNKPAQPAPGFNAGQGFAFSQPTATQTTSLFATPKPTTSFPLFNQTNTNNSTFGQQQSTFGQTNQSIFGTNFGKTATPSFGQGTQNTFGTGLGTQQNSLLGNTAKPGSLFGNTSNMLFNSTSLQPTTGFNMQPQQTQNQLGDMQGSQDLKNILDYDHVGHIPFLFNLAPVENKPDFLRATNPKDIDTLLRNTVHKESSKKASLAPAKTTKPSIFDTMTESPVSDANIYLKKSKRHLNIKNSRDREQELEDLVFPGDEPKSRQSLPVIEIVERKQSNLKESDLQETSKELKVILKPKQSEETIKDVSPSPTVSSVSFSVNTTIEDIPEELDNHDEVLSSTKKSTSCVVLNRPEYFTFPQLEDLDKYVDADGRCMIQGFTIGRVSYGTVYFPDYFDVSNLNLDEIVHIRHKEIIIYPDESKKPPLGEGLNRRAQITLDRIYPRNRSGVPITDVDTILKANFTKNLIQACEDMNAKFLEYRPESGTFVFNVQHFSKYGLSDAYETVDIDGEKKAKEAQPIQENNQLNEEKFKRTLDIEERISEIDIEEVEKASEMGLGGYNFEEYRFIPPKTRSLAPLLMTDFLNDEIVPNEYNFEEDYLQQYMDAPPMHVAPVYPENVQIKHLVPRTFDVTEDEEHMPVPLPVIPSRNYSDLRTFKGKSFKVGWLKGFNAITISASLPNSVYFCDDPEADKQLSIIEVQKTNYEDKEAAKFIIESLQLLQEQCSVIMNKAEIPLFSINKDDRFLLNQQELVNRMALKNRTKEFTYFMQIWNLCVALWGPDTDTAASRRQLVSEWLEEVVVANEFTIPQSHDMLELDNRSKVLNQIFTYLSLHEVNKAAKLASNYRMPQLSLLLTTCSQTESKKRIQQQVEQWKTSAGIDFIDYDMKKIYLLLAGVPVFQEVNICKDVDWKRALAIHLWYVSPYFMPLTDAVKLYERAFEELGYAETPDAPYKPKNKNRDILFLLLQFYGDRKQTLNKVLDPNTHTEDPTDYRLSWLLLQMFEALNVGHISENSKNHIHTCFSTQLEHMGYWEYAIFVLLFIKDNSIKRNLVVAILDRNLPVECTPELIRIHNYLVNVLKIPLGWVHTAVASKCKLNKDYWGQYQHLLYVGDYKMCHEIAIAHILPNLIVNEEFEVVDKIVSEIDQHSDRIKNWQNEGGLILEFLQLREYIKDGQFSDENELINVRKKLIRFCLKLKHFPTNLTEQCLALSEISKTCSLFLHQLYGKLESGSQEQVLANATAIEALVMPADYKINDLDKCMTEYLATFYKSA